MIDAVALSRLIQIALDEDVGAGDVTSDLTLDPQSESEGIILAREAGIMAGMPAVDQVYFQVDPNVGVTPSVEEGEAFTAGEVVATISGPTHSILIGERLALNLLQRLCGVATETSRFVKAVAGTEVTILDTRKTTPGMRDLEKYAVRQGGGANHRMGLYDGILIKENHVQAAGGVAEALERVRRGLAGRGSRFLIVAEVGDEAQAREAVDAGADRLLLDNMDPATMAKIVKWVHDADRPDIELEASGGMNLDNVRTVAETGVDYISVGALTHSVRSIDLSLLLH